MVGVTHFGGTRVVIITVVVRVAAWNRECGVRAVAAQVSKALVPRAGVPILAVSIGEAAVWVLCVLAGPADARVGSTTVTIKAVSVLVTTAIDGWMGARVVHAFVRCTTLPIVEAGITA